MFQLITVEHSGRLHLRAIVEVRKLLAAAVVGTFSVGVGTGLVLEVYLAERLPQRISDFYLKDMPEKVAALQARLDTNGQICEHLRVENAQLESQLKTTAYEHQKQVKHNEYLKSRLSSENGLEVANGGM